MTRADRSHRCGHNQRALIGCYVNLLEKPAASYCGIWHAIMSAAMHRRFFRVKNFKKH